MNHERITETITSRVNRLASVPINCARTKYNSASVFGPRTQDGLPDPHQRSTLLHCDRIIHAGAHRKFMPFGMWNPFGEKIAQAAQTLKVTPRRFRVRGKRRHGHQALHFQIWQRGDGLHVRQQLGPAGFIRGRMGVPFGWAKPVPINPLRFRTNVSMPVGVLLTAAAGPISNLLLAVGGCAALAALTTFGPPQLP